MAIGVTVRLHARLWCGCKQQSRGCGLDVAFSSNQHGCDRKVAFWPVVSEASTMGVVVFQYHQQVGNSSSNNQSDRV